MSIARHTDVDFGDIALEEQYISLRRDRLKLERDELNFRRQLLEHQRSKHSMDMLADACSVFKAAAVSAESDRLSESHNVAPKKRVQVWWEGDERFYSGSVIKTRFLVAYDDGDRQWESSVQSEDDEAESSSCEKTNGLPQLPGQTDVNTRLNGGRVDPACSDPPPGQRSRRSRKCPYRLGKDDSWGSAPAREWRG